MEIVAGPAVIESVSVVVPVADAASVAVTVKAVELKSVVGVPTN